MGPRHTWQEQQVFEPPAESVVFTSLQGVHVHRGRPAHTFLDTWKAGGEGSRTVRGSCAIAAWGGLRRVESQALPAQLTSQMRRKGRRQAGRPLTAVRDGLCRKGVAAAAAGEGLGGGSRQAEEWRAQAGAWRGTSAEQEGRVGLWWAWEEGRGAGREGRAQGSRLGDQGGAGQSRAGCRVGCSACELSRPPAQGSESPGRKRRRAGERLD